MAGGTTQAQDDQNGWMRYEHKKAGSEKFWEVRRDGRTYVVRYGKIGAKGREQRKERDSEAACVDWVQKKIEGKKREGYKWKGPRTSALWKAVGGRDTDQVVAAIEAGGDPDECRDGICLLEVAIENRGQPNALALLDAGADPSALSTCALNLVWAVTTGRADVVRKFVAAGASPNMKAVMGSPLLVAAREGHVEMVDVLIEAGANPVVGGMMETPLFAAIERGRADCALRLVAAGAADDPAKCGRRSALGHAAKAGMADVVRALVDAGADLEPRETHNEIDEDGFLSAMGLDGDDDWPDPEDETSAAAPSGEGGDSNAMIMSFDLSSHVSRSYEGATPLMVASGEGHADCARILAEAGAEVDALDERGQSAIHHATAQGHPAIVALLEAAGADPGAEAPSDQRLRLAAEVGDFAGVQAALAAGAGVDAPDEREDQLGRTALMLAAAGGHAEVVDALVAAGADIDRADDHGDSKPVRPGAFWMRDDFRERTALHLAAVNGHGAVVEQLLAAGAAHSPIDAEKNSPLMLAAYVGDTASACALLDAGADPGQVGSERRTPLQACLCNGGEAVAGMLIDAMVSAGQAARLDRKDGDGDTALHTAAVLDLGEPIEKMLVAGASPLVRNRGGELPRDRTDDRAIAALLRDHEQRRRAEGGDVPEPVDEEAERAKAARARTPDLPAPTTRELEKTYDHESVLSRLQTAAESEGFRALLPDIAKACGSDEPDDERASLSGYLFHITEGSLDGDGLGALQDRMLARGAFVFSCGRGSNAEQPGQILALPTGDRYDALAVFCTNGCNEDKTTADIVRWLMQREQVQPFRLLHVEGDTLNGRFLTPIEDGEELAQSMYDLCGDIVDQGCKTVEALAETLVETRRLYFWWD